MHANDAISLDLCEDLLFELSDLILDNPDEFIFLDLQLSKRYFAWVNGDIPALKAELIQLVEVERWPNIQTYSMVDSWSSDLFKKTPGGVANKYRDLLHLLLLEFEEAPEPQKLYARLEIKAEEVFHLIDEKRILDWLSLWIVDKYPNIALLLFGKNQVDILSHISSASTAIAFAYAPLFVLWDIHKSLKSSLERVVISHLATGKNIRRIEKFPISINKRMAHLIHNAPKEFDFNKAIWYGIIYGLKGGRILWEYFPQFFGNWKIEMDYIKMLTLFFKKYEEALVPEQLTRLLGYISHLKEEQSDFSLKGWTLNSLNRRAEAWYEAVERARVAEINRRNISMKKPVEIKDHWVGAPYQPFKYQRKDVTYRIVQLTTSKALVEEGKALKHCVGSYSGRCQVVGSSIWSLRRIEQGHSISLVTIEVSLKRRIIQTRSLMNAAPLREHMEMIIKWARAEKLKFG